VKISPKISGRIEFLQAREGDRVTRGQKLVVIDASDVKAAVRQQTAQLAEAKYRYAQAKINQYPNATAIAMQIRQQQANLAEAKYRLAQAKLNQAPADTAITTQIRQQQANLDSAEADLVQAEKTYAAQQESVKSTKEEAQAKIDSATAAVANAHAGIKSAQANLDNANAKYTRVDKLYKQGFVAAQDVDDAKTTVSVQQSALEVAKGQLQTATGNLTAAQAARRSVEQQTTIILAKADADVNAAKAKVAQTRAALDAAKANTQQTAAYAENLKALSENVAAAQAALDAAQANTRQTDAYLENLKALNEGITAAQASLDSAQAKLADTVLTSPIDGVVTARTQDPGALASPSTPILTIQSLHHVWVTIAVPQDVSTMIHLNQPATCAFDALNGQAFSGRIAQINPSADAQSRQFTVRVALDNRAKRFSPGMFARVTLLTANVKGSPAVPREALQQDRDGSSYVMVAKAGEKGMTAEKRPVVVRAQDADWVGIASGVTPADQVVTMSATRLKDGAAIRAGGRPSGLRNGQAGSGSRPSGASGASGARDGAPRGAGADGAAAGNRRSRN
jgi:RND family efflux transporter MFP subunit